MHDRCEEEVDVKRTWTRGGVKRRRNSEEVDVEVDEKRRCDIMSQRREPREYRNGTNGP